MFLRDYWYVAAAAHEAGRNLLRRWILNEPIVLYRTEGGMPVAMLDVCPHRSYPLSRGRLKGDNVECGYHGLTFEPSGKCVAIPAQVNIPPRCKARAFPIVERWKWLWIWMGDAAKADPALIPDLYWADHPDWTHTGGYLHIKCHYQLLIDNLMDLSHETFVHTTTIGNAAVAETPSQTTIDGDRVRVYRLMGNCPAPPLFTKVHGFRGNIDRTQDINFAPPSTIVIKSRSVPHGQNDPQGEMALEYRVLNGITPASANSVHHFWAVPRNFAPDEAVTKMFQEGSHRALSEDVAVLERQQENMDWHGGALRWIDVNADAGAIGARRIIARLLEKQEAAPALTQRTITTAAKGGRT